MKPFFFSASAVLWLGTNAAFAERFLKGNHPLWSQLISNCLLPFLCLASIGIMRTMGHEVPLKMHWRQITLMIVVCNLLMFLGNGSFFAAYESGGTPIQVTTVLCALPLVTVGVGVLLGAKPPTFYEYCGAAIVIAGILVSFKK